ncbi:MAG: peptidoglycan editing factor PgeF [Armatimonadota bacterium]|nr:peptidoglycan editing factor PgeF [Armatimonadota bacterium]MDR7453439.1 peptidoglycan editing factor PgeF [Armatimonadota bacterium]MDR7457349.1 peptidoglycan editing factor PgeF [Armatimonadota bacterium]MDR7511595.1 peptidoglycan editing factor PgeF [Armatimonadota bacterium]
MLLEAEAFRRFGASHAFTTRTGGVSVAPFETLNLGRGVGDDPDAVRTNRARALAALGRSPDDHVEAAQVHGAAAATVDRRHRGATIPAVDILISADPAVVLAMHGADCVPLLLLDPVRGAVAAVHAGWRGAASDAAGAAVRAMARACGTEPAALLAAIGPAIGPCCYEVDGPVFDRFHAWPWRDEVFHATGPGRWQFDLWQAIRRQLLAAGLRDGAVATVGLCTACHSALFYSHRRDRRTGRTAGLIAPLVRG